MLSPTTAPLPPKVAPRNAPWGPRDPPLGAQQIPAHRNVSLTYLHSTTDISTYIYFKTHERCVLCGGEEIGTMPRSSELQISATVRFISVGESGIESWRSGKCMRNHPEVEMSSILGFMKSMNILFKHETLS